MEPEHSIDNFDELIQLPVGAWVQDRYGDQWQRSTADPMAYESWHPLQPEGTPPAEGLSHDRLLKSGPVVVVSEASPGESVRLGDIKCLDPFCPDKREGLQHAHLRELRRQELTHERDV